MPAGGFGFDPFFDDARRHIPEEGTQYGEIERFMAEGEFEMGADRVVGPIARRQDAPSLFTAERVFFTDCHQFVRGGTFRLQETINAE